MLAKKTSYVLFSDYGGKGMIFDNGTSDDD
jgi:hypothetical protein